MSQYPPLAAFFANAGYAYYQMILLINVCAMRKVLSFAHDAVIANC
jgi:hypothetical protein